MLLFAGFDPGAKNHIRPLFEFALHVGHKAQFIDLARLEEVDENWARSYLAGQQVRLLVAGSSGNQAELPLLKVHKRTGGKTVYIVEIGLGGRLDGVDYEDFPDHLLVTNENCADELVAIGVPEYRVHITGSTHLEAISKKNWTGAQHALRNYMRIRPDQIVASFYTSPSDLAMQAVKSLIELFRQRGWPNIALIVRPHPRTSKAANDRPGRDMSGGRFRLLRCRVQPRHSIFPGQFRFFSYDGIYNIPGKYRATYSLGHLPGRLGLCRVRMGV